MDWYLQEPQSWGSWDASLAAPLSVIDLIARQSLDCRLAALLWWLVGHRTSLVVAAGPRLAGKTATLTALLAFLPPGTRIVPTQGRRESFAFLHDTDPARTCILVHEISDHTPSYLWGSQVCTLFEALSRGYMMGATMHAATPQQVLAILHQALAIPVTHLACLRLIVTLQAFLHGDEIVRRVHQATLVLPGEAPQSPLHLIPAATRDPGDEELRHHGEPQLWAALTQWVGSDSATIQEEVAMREIYLERLLHEGVRAPMEVRRAVLELCRKEATA